VRRHHGLSFTSGHAIITFAIAGLLVLVLVLVLVLPRRWGGRRVRAGNLRRGGAGVPGAHSPLDVVGGRRSPPYRT
jgi:membrane-associated phospholipid phosphatase